MNEVHLSGRLTTDPKITYTAKKMCVAKYNLAVSRDFKQKDGGPDADFPTCIAFGKQGEFAEKPATTQIKMGERYTRRRLSLQNRSLQNLKHLSNRSNVKNTGSQCQRQIPRRLP